MAEQLAKEARFSATVLKTLSDEQRSSALTAIHRGLLTHKEEILAANKIDLQAAIETNLSSSLLKRLDLEKNDKFDSMCEGVLDVAKLEDPLNKITLATEIDEGLNLYRITSPVGVLLIIFESRPDVIANITALAIKSGNAAILKGGKESLHTFQAIAEVINNILDTETDVPKNAIQLISTRSEVGDLLDQDKYIDLVIPRGSNALVRHIKENTKIPVLGHADGICSIYVDDLADQEMAIKVVNDAKTNYPAGCNAVETLLINKKLVGTPFYTALLTNLTSSGVTCHLVPELLKTVPSSIDSKWIVEAQEQEFHAEYLSLDIAIKPVDNLEAAVEHINQHSSKHTDVIITEDKQRAEYFLQGVDSAGVYWNCSSRFADGFRYGFGTEVGISTNKIHARGPVGLEGLVCYYYQLRGSGQIVGDYQGGGGNRAFIHKKLDPSSVIL